MPTLTVPMLRHSKGMKRIKAPTLSLICVFLIACSAAGLSAAQTPPASSMRGRVVDPFGYPISRASVELKLSPPGQAKSFHSETDRHGNYEFKNLSAGGYVVVVWSRGFVTERQTISLANGSDLQLDFGLFVAHPHDPFPTIVSGVILGQDRSPLAGAQVTLENAFSRRLFYQAWTDKSGRYQIEVPHPGQYVVSASVPGFAVNASAIVLPAALPRQDKVLNLTLSPLR